MNELSPEAEPKKFGVLAYWIENNHYVLDVRWADRQEGRVLFPTNGFTVVDPETHKELGRFKGEEVLKLYQEHAQHMTREEFSLVKFISEKKK